MSSTLKPSFSSWATRIGPPNQLAPEVETAKRFDLVTLSLQLALVRDDARAFDVLRRRVVSIAELLEDAKGVPAVALVRLVTEAFNRRKLGSGPTEWVLGRPLTDEEFDGGITSNTA